MKITLETEAPAREIEAILYDDAVFWHRTVGAERIGAIVALQRSKIGRGTHIEIICDMKEINAQGFEVCYMEHTAFRDGALKVPRSSRAFIISIAN
jgi:protein tyrosine/serine phosphatase